MKKIAFACISIWLALLGACDDDGAYECVAPEPAFEAPLEEVLSELDGLELEVFLDASYDAILRRTPEGLTWRGLSERNDRLDDVSDAYALRTLDLIEAIQTRLRSYERDALPREQQINLDVYDWYLTDRLRQREFLHHDYTYVASIYSRLYSALVSEHPLASLTDAEDYVARLQQVSVQVAETRAKLAARADAGIIAPEILLQDTVYGARYVASSVPRELPFYTRFAEGLAALPDVSSGRRDELLAAAEAALACHMIPAFAELADDLDRLLAMAPGEHGAGQYERGQEFYAAELVHHTTTGITADEIHDLGLSLLPDLHGRMRAGFRELGYPEGEPLGVLYDRLAGDSGILYGAQAVAELERLIAEAEGRLGEAFVERPPAELVVVPVDAGNYYIGPSSDGSRPGAFYASVNYGMPRHAMQTLVHHEAVPGHHLQVSLAGALDLSYFRRELGATAYQEGWGLYAEELAAELGWLEGNPEGELGRLQDAALRAVRLVVDTGIHARGWSHGQAVDFMIENIGMTYQDADYEVRRYIGWPGQATAYWIGKQRILDLRQESVDALGESFELAGFHTAVLASGAVPLDVLSSSIAAYIEAAPEVPAVPGPAVAGSWGTQGAGRASRGLGAVPAQPFMPGRPGPHRGDRVWHGSRVGRMGDCSAGAPGCSPEPWLRGDDVRVRVP